MSLQIAAQHLASKGRGPDTELVHMTKGEIAGLQALALSHGGTLTINPHTGLAEAGFLSSILPMLAGAAAMYVTGGMATPFLGLGAGGVGALAGAATGYLQNPKGGLGSLAMGALGGYGGGSLAGGLMDAGATGMAGLTGNTTGAEFNNLLTSNANPAITPITNSEALVSGAKNALNNPLDFAQNNYKSIGALAAPILAGMTPTAINAPAQNPGMIRPYTLTRENLSSNPTYESNPSAEAKYFNDVYTAGTPVRAPGYADGGDIGGNQPYPQSNIPSVSYAFPSQQPMPMNVLNNASDTRVDPNTGAEMFAQGGIASLGSYSDGGQLLRGPGDGVSDSIPAQIGQHQPARLADGEFVVPARIVSEIGNGSTEAGSRELYKMMARIQKSRNKTVGKANVAVDSKAKNLLPA